MGEGKQHELVAVGYYGEPSYKLLMLLLLFVKNNLKQFHPKRNKTKKKKEGREREREGGREGKEKTTY